MGDTSGRVLRLLAGLLLGLSVAYAGQYTMQTVARALPGAPGLGGSFESALYYFGFQIIILGTAAYIAHRASENVWVAALVAVADVILLFVPLR